MPILLRKNRLEKELKQKYKIIKTTHCNKRHCQNKANVSISGNSQKTLP